MTEGQEEHQRSGRMMATERMKLTNVEERIYGVLSDGEAHASSELLDYLYDTEDAALQTVYVHISNINKKLRKLKPGFMILSINNGRGRPLLDARIYRLVRKVSTGE